MWRPWTWGRSKVVEPRPLDALSYVASFVSSGLSPGLAWREVATEFPDDLIPRLIASDIERGVVVADAVAAHTKEGGHWWRVVGVSWAVVRHTGSPLGPALRALVAALRDVEKTHLDIESALVGPRQTIRLVSILPLLAVVGGALGGMEHALVVWTSAAGWAIIALAAVLMAGALWWLRLLRESAGPSIEDLSVELDIFAAATHAGLLPERARNLVREEFSKAGLTLRHEEHLDRLVAVSRRAGVPVSALAAAKSEVLRQQATYEASAKVDTMEVRLALPLGLLVLPAFVLVSIAPVLLGVWQGGFV